MSKHFGYYLAWLSAPYKRFWDLTFAILLKFYSWTGKQIVHDGITVVPLIKASRPQESAKIVAALSFIKRQDPRRFRRIQREIRIVVLMINRKGIGQYQRIGRLCLIDLISIDKKIEDVIARQRVGSNLDRRSRFAGERIARIRLGWVTSVLIHEATHGTLESKHIPYAPTTKARIEALCKAEARRFRDRMPSEYRMLAEFADPFRDEKP